jgi:hypothetical protein
MSMQPHEQLLATDATVKLARRRPIRTLDLNLTLLTDAVQQACCWYEVRPGLLLRPTPRHLIAAWRRAIRRGVA